MLKLGKVAINYMEWRYINKLSKFLESSNDLEEDEKARVMGMIYKARLLNKIDDNMMLRLCSIINNSFLFDLKKIPLYIKETNFYSLEASNFINWGLIDNYMGGSWLNDASYELNEVGLVLHEILDTENWFDN